MLPLKKDLLEILQSGIDAVRPSRLIPSLLEAKPYPELGGWLVSQNKYLLGIGKAAVSSVEAVLSRIACENYLAVAPVGVSSNVLDSNKVLFGSHPLPDNRSFSAAASILDWLHSIPEGAHLLVVLSGGASAILALPAPLISHESKTELNRLLIRSGASITEINAVRKHCSAVKGGQLGRRIEKLNTCVLVISDVIGDDLGAIGSGPFYGDNTTFVEAAEILRRYGIWDQTPEDVRRRIEAGLAGAIEETPEAGMLQIPHYVIASNSIARTAAAETARSLGYTPQMSAVPHSGTVEELAAWFSEALTKAKPGTALIEGGEVTVKVRGNGKGGRNQHLALLLTTRIAGMNAAFAAAGTDGIDGNSSAAGAWTSGTTALDAQRNGYSVKQFIDDFDSYRFFDLLGQSIVSGPTGTNVMDLYIAIVPL